MDLFVRVVRNGGFAAAGREAGLSPASMSTRISRLEERYGVRLLNRTTRSLSLTEEGDAFLRDCIRILADVEQAESRLKNSQQALSGPLRVTATFDFGRQHIEPLLTRFVTEHPKVVPYLHLADHTMNLVENGFDLGVRLQANVDSSLASVRLASNRRVLCAAPEYIKRRGLPESPADLEQHDCIVMVRARDVINSWYFETANGHETVAVQPARCANDGGLVRKWVLDGHGIGWKSICDIQPDIDAGRVVTVLDDYSGGDSPSRNSPRPDLRVVYPDLPYVPERTRSFVDLLVEYFASWPQ
ncbi:MAG: LysR family transcriptional regulator [Gammaproteobacteria bacterium]